MPPPSVDFLLIVLAGIIGGYASGLAVKAHHLSPLWSLVVGAAGGAGGYFLQGFIPLPALATGTGEYAVDDSPAVHLLVIALIGLAAGGIMALVLGFVIGETTKKHS